VGLKNGIIYETTDLNTVIAEENARNLKIQLLIIFAENVDSEDLPSRRIIVHFSRGQIKREINNIHLDDEWFNLNFEGISYRIKDKTRDATLKSVSALEERLQKLKTWHSLAPRFSINIRSILNQVVTFLTLSFLLYSISALLDIWGNPRFSSFIHTDTFLSGAALGSLIMLLVVFLTNFGLLFLNWIIPPTVIAIGDEIEQNKKNQKLREYVFWSIGVALVIGVIVNIITSFFTK
jgi:hypothetical protein